MSYESSDMTPTSSLQVRNYCSQNLFLRPFYWKTHPDQMLHMICAVFSIVSKIFGPWLSHQISAILILSISMSILPEMMVCE